MSLSTLADLYHETEQVLKRGDLVAFRQLQLVISDCMADEGDANYWILQLPWQGMVVGEDQNVERYIGGQQVRVYTRQDLNEVRNTLVFDVPIPNSALGYVRETYTTSVVGDASDASKLKSNPNVKRWCNGVRFAGFPPYGLRFHGVSPLGISHYWRFSWKEGRQFYGTLAKAGKATNPRYAEDVVPGGYLRLFYPPSQLPAWREDWQNYEMYEPYVELFDNV